MINVIHLHREDSDWSDEQVEEEVDLEEPQVRPRPDPDEQLIHDVTDLEDSIDIFENYNDDEDNQYDIENYDHDEEDIQYDDMENDEHDEENDEEDDQCFSMSLLNALQEFGNEENSLSDSSNIDIFDDIDNIVRAVDEDEEDGWHSASEQYSPEDLNIGSEDCDYTDML